MTLNVSVGLINPASQIPDKPVDDSIGRNMNQLWELVQKGDQEELSYYLRENSSIPFDVYPRILEKLYHEKFYFNDKIFNYLVCHAYLVAADTGKVENFKMMEMHYSRIPSSDVVRQTMQRIICNGHFNLFSHWIVRYLNLDSQTQEDLFIMAVASGQVAMSSVFLDRYKQGRVKIHWCDFIYGGVLPAIEHGRLEMVELILNTFRVNDREYVLSIFRTAIQTRQQSILFSIMRCFYAKKNFREQAPQIFSDLLNDFIFYQWAEEANKILDTFPAILNDVYISAFTQALCSFCYELAEKILLKLSSEQKGHLIEHFNERQPFSRENLVCFIQQAQKKDLSNLASQLQNCSI